MMDLFSAIMSHYATTELSGLLKALWNTQAPEGAEFPYAVFSLVSTVPDWTFSETFENCLFQFNVFSDKSDPVEVCNLYEKLKVAFDFYDLIVANYDTVSLVRESAILTRAEDVWQYNVTYRIVLQKN